MIHLIQHTFLLTMTSVFIRSDETRRSMALSFTHKLLVLNILNFEIDLNSSTYKQGKNNNTVVAIKTM